MTLEARDGKFIGLVGPSGCGKTTILKLVCGLLAPETIFLYAFDLIELNGDDLRRDPLQVRKATLASIVAKASPGIRFNEHIDGDGPTVFAHACKAWPRGRRLKAQGFRLPFRPLARLAQNEERKCTGREARRGGRMGPVRCRD